MIKKSFFFYFESMCHKYIPCQILALWLWREVQLFELRIIDTIVRHYSIKKWPSWSKEIVTSSKQDIKTNVSTSVCRRKVRGSGFIMCFCLRLPSKRLCRLVVVLSWLDDVSRIADTNNSGPTIWPFEQWWACFWQVYPGYLFKRIVYPDQIYKSIVSTGLQYMWQSSLKMHWISPFFFFFAFSVSENGKVAQ